MDKKQLYFWSQGCLEEEVIRVLNSSILNPLNTNFGFRLFLASGLFLTEGNFTFDVIEVKNVCLQFLGSCWQHSQVCVQKSFLSMLVIKPRSPKYNEHAQKFGLSPNPNNYFFEEFMKIPNIITKQKQNAFLH